MQNESNATEVQIVRTTISTPVDNNDDHIDLRAHPPSSSSSSTVMKQIQACATETHFDIIQPEEEHKQNRQQETEIASDFRPTEREESLTPVTSFDEAGMRSDAVAVVDVDGNVCDLTDDCREGPSEVPAVPFCGSQIEERAFGGEKVGGTSLEAEGGEDCTSGVEGDLVDDVRGIIQDDSQVTTERLDATNGCGSPVNGDTLTASLSSSPLSSSSDVAFAAQGADYPTEDKTSNGQHHESDDSTLDRSPELTKNKEDVEIQLPSLHFRSVGTATAPLALEDRECQCFPEDFLGDEQDLRSNDASNQVNHDEQQVIREEPTRPSFCSRQSLNICGMSKMDVIKMRQDLLKAQDKVQALDSTLKKMRAEKLDLLGQMKNLYATLEDKEENLNHFVKNFEIKISECNNLISRLIGEKSHLERAYQEVEIKLQNALDQCVSLNLDLDLKNQVIEQLNLQLESSQVSRSDSNLSSSKIASVAMETSFPRSSPDDEAKSQDLREGRIVELLGGSQLGQGLPAEKEPNTVEARESGTLSRKEAKGMPSIDDVLRIHIGQWKANHVLAWLEQDLNMGYYSQQCRENVKSGKVLLTMTDQELDSAFGLQSPIHRKKLRIAIDQLSNPPLKKYPLADHLTTRWITREWLPTLGLPQFGPVFEAQMVDGRILDHVTPKELEKNFTMITRTHVSSFVAGVELLRMFDFDKKKLEEQRQAAQRRKSGCLMWTNADVIRWLEDIDLQEYTTNLKVSGIHGALMVLDEKFTPAQLAAEMGLPSSKSYLFRHLTQEYADVVAPARSLLGSCFPMHGNLRTRTLSRASSSSSTSKSRREDFFSSSLSFKGSLGRAFGKKAKKDLIQVIPTSEPVRMPAELLSIFDTPSPRDQGRLYTQQTEDLVAGQCSTSLSAFSSLQSIPINVQSSNSASEVVVSSSFSTIMTPADGVKVNGSGQSTTTFVAVPKSEPHKSHKSKTPKSGKSHYFSLRAFTGSSRRKSSAK